MNILDHIKEEHSVVKGMVAKLEGASGSEKADVLKELYMTIFSHVKSEEKLLFPKAKSASEEGKEVVLALEEEHSNVAHELNLLRRIPVDDEQFDAKVGLVKELLTHHIQEEEQKFFAVAKDVFSEEELSMVLEDFEKSEQEIRKDLEEGLVMENK